MQTYARLEKYISVKYIHIMQQLRGEDSGDVDVMNNIFDPMMQ